MGIWLLLYSCSLVTVGMLWSPTTNFITLVSINILYSQSHMSKVKDSMYLQTGIWFWIYSGLGFVKIVYISIYWHVFYPKVAAINCSKLLEKFNKETRLQKTKWDFVKFSSSIPIILLVSILNHSTSGNWKLAS